MYKKSIPLTTLLLLLSLLCFSQRTFTITNGCAFANPPATNEEIYIDDDSTKVAGILKEILNQQNLEYTSYEIKSSTVKTAAATMKDGRRYILYNENFIRQGTESVRIKWKIYSILAHELAHHLLGHDFFDTTNIELRREWELQADKFSGRVMRSFCSEMEDALIAINELSPDMNHPFYPPMEVRRDFIADGWILKDDELSANGRDPCGQIIELTFGEKYKGINHAKNVKALVKEEEMVITFDDHTAGAKNGFCFSFLVTSPSSDLTPKSIEWKSDRNVPGKNKEVIWRFADDDYTRNLVLKPQDLGIATFDSNKVPKPRSFDNYLPGILGVLLGSTGIAYAKRQKKDALQDYELYKANRDLQPAQNSRFGSEEEFNRFYRQTNRQYQNSKAIRITSAAVIGVGFYLMWDQWKKHRKTKIGELSVGTSGDGVSLNYQF